MTIFAVALVDSRRGGEEVNIAAMTLLPDTPQKSRGKEPGRGVFLGNHAQPLVATQLFCRWQIPPCFLEGCRADGFRQRSIGSENVLALWRAKLREQINFPAAMPPFILRTFDEA